MTGRGLAIIARWKAHRPEEVLVVNRERLEAVLEARRSLPPEERIARKLEGMGYEVTYGFDADLGDYAVARVEGKVVAQANRAPSMLDALKMLAGELGVVV